MTKKTRQLCNYMANKKRGLTHVQDKYYSKWIELIARLGGWAGQDRTGISLGRVQAGSGSHYQVIRPLPYTQWIVPWPVPWEYHGQSLKIHSSSHTHINDHKRLCEILLLLVLFNDMVCHRLVSNVASSSTGWLCLSAGRMPAWLCRIW